MVVRVSRSSAESGCKQNGETENQGVWDMLHFDQYSFPPNFITTDEQNP